MILHYQARFGLARGAVYLDGKPQLYLEGLENDPSLALLGVRSIARLSAEMGGMRFLTLADGAEAVLDAPESAKLTQGTALEVEITVEARTGKLARARLVRAAPGEAPCRLSPPQTLKERLLARALTLGGQDVDEDADEDALDAAQTEAIDPSGPLSGGGYLSVERTRGLIACDVDLSGATGDTRRAIRRANEEAAGDIARRLRLSGWAGLVIMDLIGRRLDGQRLNELLRAGFGQTEGVVIAPVGRFGTLEFVCPWGATPLSDRAVSALSRAQALLREAVQVGEGDPGAIVTVAAPEDVRSVLQAQLQNSYDPLAPRLRLVVGPVCKVTI